MASRNQYRLQIVTNRLGVVHLRLLPPRGSEIIMAGEQLYNEAGAQRTANHIAAAAERGFKIVHVFEGPKDFEEPKA
jgi:hypothetical protein